MKIGDRLYEPNIEPRGSTLCLEIIDMLENTLIVRHWNTPDEAQLMLKEDWGNRIKNGWQEMTVRPLV